MVIGHGIKKQNTQLRLLVLKCSTLFTFYLNIIVTFSKDDSLGEETQFAPENHNKYFKPEHEARSHDSIRDYGN